MKKIFFYLIIIEVACFSMEMTEREINANTANEDELPCWWSTTPSPTNERQEPLLEAVSDATTKTSAAEIVSPRGGYHIKKNNHDEFLDYVTDCFVENRDIIYDEYCSVVEIKKLYTNNELKKIFINRIFVVEKEDLNYLKKHGVNQLAPSVIRVMKYYVLRYLTKEDLYRLEATPWYRQTLETYHDSLSKAQISPKINFSITENSKDSSVTEKKINLESPRSEELSESSCFLGENEESAHHKTPKRRSSCPGASDNMTKSPKSTSPLSSPESLSPLSSPKSPSLPSSPKSKFKFSFFKRKASPKLPPKSKSASQLENVHTKSRIIRFKDQPITNEKYRGSLLPISRKSYKKMGELKEQIITTKSEIFYVSDCVMHSGNSIVINANIAKFKYGEYREWFKRGSENIYGVSRFNYLYDFVKSSYRGSK